MSPTFLIMERTCEACPEQYEGVLSDGTWFYFRYRFGRASLGIGGSIEEAISDFNTVTLLWGDSLQGMFDSIQDRDNVLLQLLRKRAERGN